jgi:hypothetical protein
VTKEQKALGLIANYGSIDGGHHKQWVIDQIVRILAEDYNQWVIDFCNGEEGPDTYEWDTGIAP